MTWVAKLGWWGEKEAKGRKNAKVTRARVAKVDRVERMAGVAWFTSEVRVPRVLRWPGRQGLQGWPQW